MVAEIFGEHKARKYRVNRYQLLVNRKIQIQNTIGSTAVYD